MEFHDQVEIKSARGDSYHRRGNYAGNKAEETVCKK
jgi:hypothetical protein